MTSSLEDSQTLARLDWAALREMTRHAAVAPGYRLALLERSQVTGVIGALARWFPDVSVGSASGYLEQSFYQRRVWFADGWHQTPVYARDRLPMDVALAGPAILEQLDCTTVVEPGDTVRQDKLGNLLIAVR